MLRPPLKFPFQFRASRTNKDIQLVTTSDPKAILHLIDFFELEEEISQGILILLDPGAPEMKTAIISLRSHPAKSHHHAYTALLECDLCGVRGGFFAVFRSLSGDVKTLTEECKEMADFLNEELRKEKLLEEIGAKR
jgi:hypothetical protein